MSEARTTDVAAAIIAIAVVVVVVLAALVLRRRSPAGPTSAAPARCPRETRKRDRSRPRGPAHRGRVETAPTGREVERAAVLERPGGDRRRAGRDDAPPAPWSPPDPEAIGVTRRQFLNRGIVGADGRSASAGFGAAGFVAFLWPTASGGFGCQDQRSARSTTSWQPIRTGNGLLLRPEAAPGSPRTRPTPWPRPRRSTPPASLAGMEAGRRRPLPEVRRTSAAACRACATLAVVRVPVPRLAVQPGRREEGRPGAPRPGPLRRHGRRRRRRHRRHRRDRPGPADRHQHHRPRGRGPALHHRRRSTTDARCQLSTHRNDVDRLDHRRRHRRRLDRLRRRSTSRSAAPEVGSEIELAANRKPYYDDEELEGQRLERVQLVGVLLLVVIVIGLPALLAARAGPPGRRHRAAATKRLAGWGARPVRRRPAQRRLQLRRLPRRHERRRAASPPYTDHRPADRRGRAPVDVEGAGAQHRAVPLRRRRGARTSSPTAGPSRRCRRGASPAAAR